MSVMVRRHAFAVVLHGPMVREVDLIVNDVG